MHKPENEILEPSTHVAREYLEHADYRRSLEILLVANIKQLCRHSFELQKNETINHFGYHAGLLHMTVCLKKKCKQTSVGSGWLVFNRFDIT